MSSMKKQVRYLEVTRYKKPKHTDGDYVVLFVLVLILGLVVL